jgi:hypothetical protein
VHKKAIEVDAHLRVKGAPLGEVYAIGDASTVRILLGFLYLNGALILPHQIETSIVSHLLELVDESDKNKDGKIDYEEWSYMGESLFLCCNVTTMNKFCYLSEKDQEEDPDV